jgi:hypothetical protein
MDHKTPLFFRVFWPVWIYFQAGFFVEGLGFAPRYRNKIGRFDMAGCFESLCF